MEAGHDRGCRGDEVHGRHPSMCVEGAGKPGRGLWKLLKDGNAPMDTVNPDNGLFLLVDDPVQATLNLLGVTAGAPASPRPGHSICVVCCSTASMPHDTAMTVARAFATDASVRVVILSESVEEPQEDGAEVVVVPDGTKLSKIRRLSDLVSTDLICICDPDLSVEADGCQAVLRRALAEAVAGREVIAFGIVEGKDHGTLLSRVIALDKWLSHRVLRRTLWAVKAGLTLPGQFLIVSLSLFHKLDPGVDSYLDDLYLGWVARRQGVRVCRVPVVIGQEDSRDSWGSLLTQRLRWMRGLACLFGHLRSYPSAVGLLAVHYFAYHALPILAMVGIVLLTVANPVAGLGVFFFLALLLAIMSRRSLLAAVAFLAVFPVVHLLATLLWWMPASRSLLRRR